MVGTYKYASNASILEISHVAILHLCWFSLLLADSDPVVISLFVASGWLLLAITVITAYSITGDDHAPS